MQFINTAFPLKQIVSGILLSFCAFQTFAEPLTPEAAVYAGEWLPVYPQVSVNGSTADGLFKFMSHHGRLFVQTDTLVSLGVRVPLSHVQQAKQAEGKAGDTDGTIAPEQNTISLAAAGSESETEPAASERPSEKGLSENPTELDGQSPTDNQAYQGVIRLLPIPPHPAGSSWKLFPNCTFNTMPPLKLWHLPRLWIGSICP